MNGWLKVNEHQKNGALMSCRAKIQSDVSKFGSYGGGGGGG